MHSPRIPRQLAPGASVVSALLWLADNAFNFRDLLKMNVPEWFWSAIFAAIFFASVLGMVFTQGKDLERLKRERLHDQPGTQVGEQSIRSVLLVDRLESFMRAGGDIVEGLQRVQQSQATPELMQAVHEWGRSVYHALKSKYPGYAAFFLSDLPSEDERYERELLLGYMNRRLGDLRAVIEREFQSTKRS